MAMIESDDSLQIDNFIQKTFFSNSDPIISKWFNTSYTDHLKNEVRRLRSICPTYSSLTRNISIKVALHANIFKFYL